MVRLTRVRSVGLGCVPTLLARRGVAVVVSEYRVNGENGAQTGHLAHQIIFRHEDFIRAVIRFHSRNASDEEDLYQELFLSLIVRPVPAEVRNIRSYLYRVISRDAADLVRRDRANQEIIKKYREESGGEARRCEAPEKGIALTEELDTAFRRLAVRLCPRVATAVRLRYRENCSIAEIAREMGVEKRTVSRYIARGVRTLRWLLAIE